VHVTCPARERRLRAPSAARAAHAQPRSKNIGKYSAGMNRRSSGLGIVKYRCGATSRALSPARSITHRSGGWRRARKRRSEASSRRGRRPRNPACSSRPRHTAPPGAAQRRASLDEPLLRPRPGDRLEQAGSREKGVDVGPDEVRHHEPVGQQALVVAAGRGSGRRDRAAADRAPRSAHSRCRDDRDRQRPDSRAILAGPGLSDAPRGAGARPERASAVVDDLSRCSPSVGACMSGSNMKDHARESCCVGL